MAPVDRTLSSSEEASRSARGWRPGSARRLTWMLLATVAALIVLENLPRPSSSSAPLDAWKELQQRLERSAVYDLQDIDALLANLRANPRIMPCGEEPSTGLEEFALTLPTSNPLPPERLAATTIGLVLIPGGTFEMGGTDLFDGKPVHRVSVRPFLLGQTAVTNSQMRMYVDEGPGTPRPGGFYDSRYDDAMQPVVGVNWDEARAFCAWIGGRLPTEAEREYACRAGTTTAYSFGDDPALLDDFGWCFLNSGKDRLPPDTLTPDTETLAAWGCSLKPVGLKRPNPWGLFDVHGNVWEWCEDAWQASYEHTPTDGTASADARSTLRMLRGGSFTERAVCARSAFRRSYDRAGRAYDIGFRVALTVAP